MKLTPLASKDLLSATFCLRFYTDLHSTTTILFSISDPSDANRFSLFRVDGSNDYHLYAGGAFRAFYALPFDLNKWNSACATWDADTGFSVMINGIDSVKAASNIKGSIAGTPIIILGQDQDSYGGGFEAAQAFMGRIKDVHMWDHVISACDIRTYMQGFSHHQGNYLDGGKNLACRYGYHKQK